MARFHLYLFGPPQLELDGKPVSMDRSKAVALLAFLAVDPGEHTRQDLAALFWPEYEAARAYAYLRRTLWTINDAVGEGWLQAGREVIALANRPDIWVDVLRYRSLVEGCTAHSHPLLAGCQNCLEALSTAAALYTGDFLAGFSLRDSPSFDSWQTFEAESLRRTQASVLERLSGCYIERGEPDLAITTARQWLALDPLDEGAHRGLMLAYARAGQRSAALRQYEECQRVLLTELGLEPAAETAMLAAQIKTAGLSSSPVTVPQPDPQTPEPLTPEAIAPAPATARPSNLPIPSTPFVGRSSELENVSVQLHDPTCRLLTLAGPGGIGKTRLAIEAAARASQNGAYPHGVYFVSLAPLTSAGFLVETVAEALGVFFRPEEAPRPQLLHWLRARRLLLVMDNFEHLTEGAGLLAEILANAPGVRILVTSRERLNLREECILEVAGMAYPERDDEPEMEKYEAVNLFVQNARRVQVGYMLDAAERPAVARICRLLQGMPLGIELAAAWTKLLSGAEIAAEVENSLDFLDSSLRGLPVRHQSLRAVFEHSWNLLSPAERVAFAQLSVFRSPFRLEAGRSVLKTGAALPLLSGLLDKSMLRRGPDGRYAMHELLKQYGAEKLGQEPDQETAARRRHALFYARFLAEMKELLRGSQQVEALQKIETEIDDIRQAWRWLVEHDSIADIHHATTALSMYCEIRIRFKEGEELFHLAAKRLRDLRTRRPEPDPYLDLVFAFVLHQEGSFISSQGRYEEYQQLYRESLEIVLERASVLPEKLTHLWALVLLLLRFGEWESEDPAELQHRYGQVLQIFTTVGDDWSTAMAKLVMAEIVHYRVYDLVKAHQLREESLAIFSALGNRWGMVLCLNELANVAYDQGSYQEARQMSLHGLEICRELGDEWRTISCLLVLGQVDAALGEYARAEASYRDCLHIVRETGNPSLLAVNLDCLGYVYSLQEDYTAAERCFEESLRLNRLNHDNRAGMALMNLGDIARARGDFTRARRMYQEGLDYLHNFEMPWGVAIIENKLGLLDVHQGDLAAARARFRKALGIAVEIERFPMMVEVLIGWCSSLAQEGRLEEAVELLALCLAHPAIANQAREQAGDMLSDLAAEIPPAIFAAAHTRGQSLKIDYVVAQILSTQGE